MQDIDSSIKSRPQLVANTTNLFDVHVTVHHDKFLQQNQPDALISQIYSWNETLRVLDSFSVHHQEFFTVHTAMVYVIQVCWQPESRIRIEHSDPARLSGRFFCDDLITRLEESYRMCCVVVCNLKKLWMRRQWPTLGRSTQREERIFRFIFIKKHIKIKDFLEQRNRYRKLPIGWTTEEW
jgi:hypothetical protein